MSMNVMRPVLLLILVMLVSFDSQGELTTDAAEEAIFQDGFEGGLSGPLVASVTIGPEGGDFELSNGIGLGIPPGAVPEETLFHFRLVPPEEIVLPENMFKTHDISYLGGFEATPYGYMFEAPIEIRIPASVLPDSTHLPFPMFRNTETGEFVAINDLEFVSTGAENPYGDLVTPSEVIPAPPDYEFWSLKIYVRCDGLLVMPETSALPLNDESLAYLALAKVLQESDCVKNPCRCCRVEIESEDFDSSSESNDGCYSVYSNGFIKYPDCEAQPIEPWGVAESDLLVTVSADAAMLKVDDVIKFSFSMKNDSGDPVTDFSITPDVSIEDPSVIDTWGFDDHSIWFKGVSAGTSKVEITLAANDCQYKAWLTVEVVDDVAFVTDPKIVVVTEGCTNTMKVKLKHDPTTPVDARIRFKTGDSDIQVDGGSDLRFDETNWWYYRTITFSADWDVDTDSDTAEFEISGSTPDHELIEVLTKSVTVEEYDISNVHLAIDASYSTYNKDSFEELHETLFGTVSLNIVQGIATGQGTVDYDGYGFGYSIDHADNRIRCNYVIDGVGEIDVEGFTTCIENDCTLSVTFKWHTDYMFTNSCSSGGPYHNIDYYIDDSVVNLGPLNNFVFEETEEYTVEGALFVEHTRIEWLFPPPSE